MGDPGPPVRVPDGARGRFGRAMVVTVGLLCNGLPLLDLA